MLAGMGIATGVYYPRPVFDYPVFRDHPRVTVSPTPNASRASAEVLSLPVHPSLATTDIDRIIEGVRWGFGA
jgi:dTDP-4-amino-4,6-dideoxygalactose transaminase